MTMCRTTFRLIIVSHLLLALSPGDASAATTCGPGVGPGAPDPSCTNPAATECKIASPPPGYPNTCVTNGFPVYVSQSGGIRLYCVESSCTTTRAAAVPELDDYAAVLFVGSAVLIGWRVRRRQLPVG